jgi:hypothetical protein
MPRIKSSQKGERKSPLPSRANAEAEELDALNAQIRQKRDTTRLIEASIEANAKKRRREEKPASSSWKPST